MRTFINELATKIYEEHKEELGNVRIVFPNRRAGLFMQKELGKLIKTPVWLPEIISMEDFVTGQSPLTKIEKLSAVFILHKIYKRHQPSFENLEKFYFWGEMILKDFEEIDQYLVDASNLFKSVKTQKELDEEFFFLDEEERKILETFWSTFLPDATKTQESFLETWKLLWPIYEDFRKELLDQKKGYGGLIYREFLNQIKTTGIKDDKITHFAGFNALTYAEEGIIGYFIEELHAHIHWDFDAYYFGNKKQEAGIFLREYQRKRVFAESFNLEEKSHFNQTKSITVTGVSLEMGQAKAMSELLSEIVKGQDFRPEETVIVLPHEHMLFPVLESLPSAIESINITMGYSLKDTPVFSLVDSLLQLQETSKDHEIKGRAFYYRPLTEIIEHPLLYKHAGQDYHELVRDIKKKNRIYIYKNDLPEGTPVLEKVFEEQKDPISYLRTFLKNLNLLWQDETHELEQEFIARYYEYISDLKDLIGAGQYEFDYSFFRKLFKRMAQSLKIPFTGEPLNGIQVMGILETRNLDFKNVIVLNMNEDSWPAPSKKGSFIPYNIRKAFQLPTHEHQDSIYSYLFYRLLQRAENIDFFYNTVSDFNLNGEVSRLIRQLEIESPHSIKHKFLSNPVNIVPSKPIIVEKTPLVLKKMARFTTDEIKNASALTPSALDTYLYCKLRFYYKYVQEIYEPEEIQAELDPAIFGNILHDTMEILYDDYMKRTSSNIVNPQDFFWLKSGLDGAINRAFLKHYNISSGKKDKFEFEGRNIIAKEIIQKMATRILDVDQSYAPFKILGLEASTKQGYAIEYPVKANAKSIKIRLKGKIDRLDLKQGVARVVDYKTGKDERSFESLESLIDRDKKTRNKAAFQVLFYSYLFLQGYEMGDYDRIEPGLFNSKELFKDEFDWRIYHKKNGAVHNFMNYVDEFENILGELLSEIWDENQFFDQVEDERKCNYCPYNQICQR